MQILTEYWYLWLVLVGLILLLIWASKKAFAAVKKHSEIVTRERAYLERFTMLTKKYHGLDHDLAVRSDAAELMEGVTACLQREIEKAPVRLEAFNNAEEWRRKVYAAYYFTEDAEKSLSEYFRNNAEPTAGLAVGLIRDICPERLSRTVNEMYSMYDSDNDRVSYDPKRIGELDAQFAKEYDKTDFCRDVKTFILENIS